MTSSGTFKEIIWTESLQIVTSSPRSISGTFFLAIFILSSLGQPFLSTYFRETLPGLLKVLIADVSPSYHTISVRFKGAKFITSESLGHKYNLRSRIVAPGAETSNKRES